MPPIFVDATLSLQAPVPYHVGEGYRFGDLRVIIYAAAFRQQMREGSITADEVIEATREMMQRPQLVRINGCLC